MKKLILLMVLSAVSLAGADPKPDVLFIAIDDMNDWTTLFDKNNPIKTPNLERLAARGTFFKRAHCASAGCNPSRTAIMTGLRPTTSGVYHNRQAWRERVPDAISLPEYFANEGGYKTLGAGKIYHHGHKESFIYDQTTKADPDSPKSLHRMVQCYQAASDYADQMVGRLLDKLDETGRADNTIIVLWSDHGYHLGDKQCAVKFTLWEKATHVPFIIVAPGISEPGSVCEAPVSLVDIYPTLVELAGLPPKADNDGASLVPLLVDSNAEWTRPALMTEGPGNHAIRTPGFRYIRYYDGFEELYKDNDPWNHTNLAADAEYAQILAQHRAHLPKTEAPGIPARHQTLGNKARKQPNKKP